MVAELNEIWGETTSQGLECDKIMEHIKNCPECQRKLNKQLQSKQVVEKFQNQPQQMQQPQQTLQTKQFPQMPQNIQRMEKVKKNIPNELDLLDKFFEYSDIILIGLTIYLLLKAL